MNDVRLPKLAVLGSEMAYREAGSLERRHAKSRDLPQPRICRNTLQNQMREWPGGKSSSRPNSR
jgi:hypothetical protein